MFFHHVNNILSRIQQVTFIDLKGEKLLYYTMAEEECKVEPNKSVEFTEKTVKITKKRLEDIGKSKGKGIDMPTDELEDLLDYPE